jgi:hypothetical protein
MKMQIQLKYGLAEKSASIGVSAGRNVFPHRLSGQKLVY